MKTKEEWEITDWDKSGLLYGLEGRTYDLVKGYLQQIDWGRSDNQDLHAMLPGVVRRVLTNIVLPDTNLSFYFKHGELLRTKVLSLFNLNDIIDRLNNLLSNVDMDLFSRFFPNLDGDAEIVLLFCRNYEQGLISEARKQ